MARRGRGRDSHRLSGLHTAVKDFYREVWTKPEYIFSQLLSKPGATIELLKHDP